MEKETVLETSDKCLQLTARAELAESIQALEDLINGKVKDLLLDKNYRDE